MRQNFQSLRLDTPLGTPHMHSVTPRTFFALNNNRVVSGKYKQYAIWIPLIKDDPRKVLAIMSKPDTRAISDDGDLCVETFYSKSPAYSMYRMMKSEPENIQ